MTTTSTRAKRLRLAFTALAAAAGMYAAPLAVQSAYATEPEADRCTVTCSRGTCTGEGACTCTCSTFLDIATCTCSGGGGGGGGGSGPGENQT